MAVKKKNAKKRAGKSASSTEFPEETTDQKGPGSGSDQDGHLSEQEALERRVAVAALDESLFPNIQHPKKKAYLIALAETGNRTHAAKLAGIERTTPYTPQWKQDEAFQERLRQAKEAAADLIESEIYRRAVEGVDKPTGWYKGVAGGVVREFSDVLAMFLLKGLRPETYRERVELQAAMLNLDLNRLDDESLERIANGEPPMAVLSEWAAGARARGEDPVELLGLPPGEG